MDIPRGEIVLESPLEFINLRNTLGKFKENGYLEVLISGENLEEGYVFLESGSIIGIFYEGHREGEPVECIKEMLHDQPAIILHKLSDTQLDVVKDVYSLDEKHDMSELLEAGEAAKEEAAEGAEVTGTETLADWERKVPIIRSAGQMGAVGKKELLEGVEKYIRNILKYVDGKRTMKEISKECGEPVEDVIGVIEPYRETGYIRYKE